MCDIMEADQDHTMTNSTNKYVNSDVEQLQRELATLEIRNRELEQVLEKLREENWQLKQKVTSSPGVLNGDNCAAPPPPPPPPPPPGLLSPPASIAQIVKQRRSEGVHSGKLNDNVKKDEASSRQNQLIMEVVNFLKSGGFSKSKRQRSLTQPDFSQELAKFKESRGIETAKDIAIEKFKSLKKRSEKGVCLAKELDSLKTSQKNNESSKDTSPLSTPDQTGRRTVTVSKIRSFNNNGTLADATAKCVIVSETKTASVADLLLKLEQISGDGTRSGSKPSTPAASRISSPQSVRKNSSVKQNCFIDRDGLVMDTNDTMADNIEEREAQVTFAIDRPSSEASLRCQSRSSGIASSLFSERLSDSSLTSETDQEPDDKGWLRATKCASPQIIITSVDDPAENLVDEAFQKASTKVGIDEINRPDERHPQQEFSVATSFPLTKVIENGVNGLRLRPPTIFQMQAIQQQSTRNKQRFWEEAVAPKGRSLTKTSTPLGNRSPTLEKFVNATRTTIKNNNQIKMLNCASHIGQSVQSQQNEPSSLKINPMTAAATTKTNNHNPITSLASTSFISTQTPSTKISRRAANMNKFRI